MFLRQKFIPPATVCKRRYVRLQITFIQFYVSYDWSKNPGNDFPVCE